MEVGWEGGVSLGEEGLGKVGVDEAVAERSEEGAFVVAAWEGLKVGCEVGRGWMEGEGAGEAGNKALHGWGWHGGDGGDGVVCSMVGFCWSLLVKVRVKVDEYKCLFTRFVFYRPPSRQASGPDLTLTAPFHVPH